MLEDLRHHEGKKSAFNLDTRHIMDREIYSSVDRFFQETDPKQWVVEWTEHEEGDHGAAAKKLRGLRDRYGIEISIDDVGAGVNGLQRMQAVRCANWIKIDGGLFQRARGEDRAKKVIKAICGIVRECGARSVIEWIESDSDLDLAKELGADCGQGFHFTFAAQKPSWDSLCLQAMC